MRTYEIWQRVSGTGASTKFEIMAVESSEITKDAPVGDFFPGDAKQHPKPTKLGTIQVCGSEGVEDELDLSFSVRSI